MKTAPIRRRRFVAAVCTTALVGTGFALTPAAAAAAPSAAVIKVAAKDYTTVAIGADGVIYGAGNNQEGQLTGDNTGDKTTLTAMTGLPSGVTAVSVATGYQHTVVIGSNGVTYGTGDNDSGQLTGDDTANKTTLTQLTGLPSGVKAVNIGASYNHTVVIGSNGVAYGTGDNSDGQLTGNPGVDKTTLTAMTGLPSGVKATGVAVGDYHVLILGSNGAVYGAGSNGDGQLTGEASSKTTLTQLTGLPSGVKATAIAAGFDHSLVIGSNGAAYGTGDNGDGQLTGDSDFDKYTLTQLTGLPSGVKATAIAGGGDHSVVVGSNGAVYGTGDNSDGQLTGDNTGDKTTLTTMTGLPSGVKATGVAAGDEHSVVVGSNGIIYGTGYNGSGQLTGDSVNKRTLTPFTGQVIATATTPKISGPSHVGATARVNLGSWFPQPTAFSYQWRINGNPIAGATGSTYKVRASDWRQALSVVVTGKRTGVTTGSKASSAVRIMGVALGYNAAKKPGISGTAKVGKTLKVKNLSKRGWHPDASTLSYQWLRNGSPIKAATKASYKLKKADKGKTIKVRITAKRAHHVNGVFTSKASKKVKK